MNIRLYKDSDYEMICGWWGDHKQPAPPRELLSNHTFILENDDWIPWVCLSLIPFGVKHMAWSSGLVSNPNLPKTGRREAVEKLWDFVADEARQMGYNNLICFAPCDELERRYSEMGFKKTQKVTCMVRSLEK